MSHDIVNIYGISDWFAIKIGKEEVKRTRSGFWRGIDSAVSFMIIQSDKW